MVAALRFKMRPSISVTWRREAEIRAEVEILVLSRKQRVPSWIAGALTLITGVDYFMKALPHLRDEK